MKIIQKMEIKIFQKNHYSAILILDHKVPNEKELNEQAPHYLLFKSIKNSVGTTFKRLSRRKKKSLSR